jgi:hypothetical protein
MVQQVNHGVGLKLVRCIITMSGERRDDTCANLPVDGCNRFSRPTTSHPHRGSAFPTSPGFLYNVPQKAGEGGVRGSERVYEFSSPESWLVR